MKVAFVIGNGKSRADIDLKPLKNIGYNIGCNAIVRDWHPDNIVVPIDVWLLKLSNQDTRAICTPATTTQNCHIGV